MFPIFVGINQNARDKMRVARRFWRMRYVNLL